MKTLVFIGTYTQDILFGTGQVLHGQGEGIYCYELNMESGKLRLINMKKDVVNPSYLTLDQSQKYLYAVNELKEFNGMKSGAISSFTVDPKTYELRFLNQKATNGTDPCHVTVNQGNTHVFVSNFMSGSVCVYKIKSDGSLSEPTQFIQHEGSSVNPKRQTSPHAHSLIFDPNNEYAFVPDLGIDKVVVYKTDYENGKLVPGKNPFYKVTPGAGPRHCVFHPNKNYCYLINELNCTIEALHYNQDEGELTKIQSVPTLLESYSGENSCADIHISPNGRYVYGSNRGHNSIVIYKVDQETGRLEYVDTTSTYGQIPRNFEIEPTGKYMLVANQDSDNVITFHIDSSSGKLSKVAESNVPTPVCVKAYQLK